jgi:PAS domain S-box-containing protein
MLASPAQLSMKPRRNLTSDSMLESTLSGGGAMGDRIRSLDWSKTPLGPVESWPQSLKTSVSICLNSRFPVLIWWGADLVKIYNDAYIPLIGTKHPAALGRAGRLVWPEIWDTIQPLLAGVLERGEASWSDDLQLFLNRHGYSEECYFTFSYSPIRDESGGIGGVFTPVVETTDKVIGERRLRTLRDLAAARSSRSHDVRDACNLAVRWLAANPADVPFAAIYLLNDSRTALTLAGVSSEALGLPQTIDLSSPPPWLPIDEILATRISILPVAEMDFAAPPMGAWDCPVDEVASVPVISAHDSGPVALLLLGVNPRKRLDRSYEAFFLQLAEQLGETIREAKMMEREAQLLREQDAERGRIRALFQQAPAAILMLHGPEHTIELLNALYFQLTGRASDQELLGKPIAEALPEIVSQGFVDLLDQVYRTGQPYIGNEVLAQLGPDGSRPATEAYFNFIYQPTRDAAGDIDGILVHAVNVTEQVLARHEIESREQQFRVLADSMPQMAWMANAAGDLFWYNRRWYEYTGTNFEQMHGWGWQSVHDPKVLPTVIERYNQSLATGEPFSMTFPIRGADGQFRNFLTLAQPLRDSSGKIMRWFGTNTDVEAQRKTEQALRQSEKLAAVGRLASSIAHEINNPLEAITNLVYLAKGSGVSPEALEYLESAEVELGRVAQIAAQTLRFHRQTTAQVATDVADLIQSVLTLYRSKLTREDIHLEVKAEPCPPLVCYAGEIRQVFANLIGNALDAMPRGGSLRIRLRPSVEWRTQRAGVRVTVADSGYGMSPETLKRLYEPFYTTKESIGTGLGLWVSSGITQKHGGTIHVRSTREPSHSGTTFQIFFPYDGLAEDAEPPDA